MRHFYCLILLIFLLLALPAATPAAAPPDPFTPSARQAVAELEALGGGALGRFTIHLRDQLILSEPAVTNAAPSPEEARTRIRARREAVERQLQGHANRSQQGILAAARILQARGEIASVTSFWIFNGLSVEASAAGIRALAARPEVLQIRPDPDPAYPIAPTNLSPWPPPLYGEGGSVGSDLLLPTSASSGNGFLLPLSETESGLGGEVQAPTIQPNIVLTNAPELWALGYTGQGVVAAILDTGVDGTHPDLAPNWRGGSNSWFDPYGEHATPFDAHGHGTHVMGILAGEATNQTYGAIGMAPGAQWIAAKIFNDSGGYSESAVHLAFQWVLDPDGNPATPDGADLVNNSWGYTIPGQCMLTFQADIQNLRAAGVMPVFSAGNGGPGSTATDLSPGNNPAAFAVGGITNTDLLYSRSSRGPSSCDTALAYPRLVAPGVSIFSAYREINPGVPAYATLSGTSMAAPHAAGALALLLSAHPDLPLALQEYSLIHSAFDLGDPGYDFSFGAGRLDVLAAYQWARAAWGSPLKTYLPLVRRSFFLFVPVSYKLLAVSR